MFKRIISATVGVLLMIAVLFVSDEYKYLFNIVVSLLAAVSVGEIFVATKFISHKPLTITSILFAAFIPFTTVNFIRPFAGLVIFAYAVFMLIVMLRKRKELPLRDVSLLFMLTVLIPFAFSMLIRLRDIGFDTEAGMWKRDGVFLLVVACCCSWFADTGAYFTGRFLGKHKLAPEISPKKTIEGFIGGVAANMLGMWALSTLYMLPRVSCGAIVNIPLMVMIAFVAAFLGTLGDLSASYIKRSCHVKDFGNIMPGHGGVMDRFDSILLVAPFVYLVVSMTMQAWPLIIR